MGQGCVLPGGLSPEEFGERICAGEDLLRDTPEGRWGVSDKAILSSKDSPRRDTTWSKKGGYVTGFDERFDPSTFGIDSEHLSTLDPLFKWLCYAAQQALQEISPSALKRTGAILGNLSYPSHQMSRYAESHWFDEHLSSVSPPPEDRFMSGFPVLSLRRALGIEGPSFALDSACASSLYAIKLACDVLHDKRADVMLAGAVNGADDLFIHVGFCALNAMSKTGQSRPFHKDADGLVPAEGAAVVALKRLEDAQADGDTILGVIRGIGLSNDGNAKGILAPSQDGQIRAIRAAYEEAGLSPDDVGYLECHATGTPVGDSTELYSMSSVFKEKTPIASLKSNLGHLITAAGGAALLKVLYQFKTSQLAPSLHVDEPNPALKDSPFEIVKKRQPWNSKKIAGISAFGFGGNNAHLIVSAPEVRVPKVSESKARRKVAVVGIDLLVGSADGVDAFRESLKSKTLEKQGFEKIQLDLKGLRFPPNDLKLALGQQLSVLRSSWGAIEGLSNLPYDRMGVWIGLGADPDVCRYGARWRLSDSPFPVEEVERIQESCVPSLQSAGVIGAMPNMPANRINTQWGLGGASSTISAEEGSGLVALQAAVRAIEVGELDAAVIGAVDLSCNPVHESAVRALLKTEKHCPLDASVVWVVQALDHAEENGHPILAIMDNDTLDSPSYWPQELGHSHAASGLLDLTAGLVLAKPEALVSVRTEAMGGHTYSASLRRKTAPFVKTKTMVHPISFLAHLPLPLPLNHSIMKETSKMAQVMASPPELMAISILRGSNDHLHVEKPSPSNDQGGNGYSTQDYSQASLGPVGDTVAVEIHRQLTEMSIAHTQFLNRQHQIHQIFLEQRRQQEQVLLRSPIQLSSPRTSQLSSPQRDEGSHTPSVVLPPKPLVPREGPKTAPKETDLFLHDVSELAPSPLGMTLDKEGLTIHSRSKISDIFGPMFQKQDHHKIQTRMPEPPLLLADRMTGLDAKPGSMGTGVIWTETDVRSGSWWLNGGRMPAGIMIESGQADLMLISYLGIDLLSEGDRAYRLLGCELMYHDDLPAVGDTLCYDIHVDGHANHGPVRIFFFHYDCRINGKPRLSVRQGQAGFFTKAELGDSAGILWEPDSQSIDPNSVLDAPDIPVAGDYTLEQIIAFSEGRPWDCFGLGCMRTRTHTRSPSIQKDNMLFLRGPIQLDPKGGPWKRGYFRCEVDIHSDDWFFEGHFKNDPCMPGTLMFEGCLQAMAFVMTAYGYTNLRDGWRFQPVRNKPYPLRCRGQVTPQSKKLIYEVFIEEVSSGPEPYLIADLLCTIDGLKAFHARGMGLELVPDFPLSTMPELLEISGVPEGVAQDKEGFPFDWKAMISSALGKPSEAFGRMYSPFDGHRRVARLPGPPYHFMSRVDRIEGDLGTCQVGTKIVLAYDIPPDAWYFQVQAEPVMPFCVLLEAALQPCGWLASAVGSALTIEEDLSFRNLDGEGTLLAELFPDSGTLYTEVEITSISKSAGMIIEAFTVRCYTDLQDVYHLKTVFGFFPDIALKNQVGLPTSDEERQDLYQHAITPIVLEDNDSYCTGSAALPSTKLRMLDRIVGWSPKGGVKGLGFARADKTVDPSEWFFKAHFFQDPVQPGSLGIEAMIQLLQWAMLQKGAHHGIVNPRFECLGTGASMSWQYRGQVLPENDCISTTLDIISIETEPQTVYYTADASLWIDGKRIYQAKGIMMRVKQSNCNDV